MVTSFIRIALCFVVVLAGCMSVPDAEPTDDARLAAANSTSKAAPSARIRADVFWLADDARTGREAGTPGYDEAANYVAARLEQIGVMPGVNEGTKETSWFQPVSLLRSTPVLDDAKLSLIGPDGVIEQLTHLEDFRVFPGTNKDKFSVAADAVFVGYGVYAPDEGIDDFAGLDLEGKVAVYLSGAPDTFNSEQRAHFQSGALKAKNAADRGAVATVTLFSKALEKRTPWQRFVSNPSRSSMTWLHPNGQAETSAPEILGRAALNPSISERVFEHTDQTFEGIRSEAARKGGRPVGFDLNLKIAFSGALTKEIVTSDNVIGLVRGTDPALRDEFVVISAHLDHIGINERKLNKGEDGINNGAMDNALGVGVMLEAAARLADDPPNRSVIFLAVTAEEFGLLGADFYAHYPTVPLGSIVANVNLDMPVMLHSFTDVVAFGAERSTLGPVVRDALAKKNIALSPDPLPEQGIFTRSDHYRFVEKGIPAVYLLPGFQNGGEEKFTKFLATHYHKPSDQPDLPILYDDVARFAALNELIIRQIADDPERPSWNQGDFFGDLFGGDEN